MKFAMVNASNTSLDMTRILVPSHIEGAPSVVQTPVGYGWHFASPGDTLTFTYGLRNQCLCPFSLSSCGDGATFTIWIRQYDVDAGAHYKIFFTINDITLKLYKKYPERRFKWRMYADEDFQWYTTADSVKFGVWHHLALVWYPSFVTAAYVDGIMVRWRNITEPSDREWKCVDRVVLNPDTKESNFSVGQMLVWDEVKKPAYIYRLYHEGVQ